MVYEFKCKNCNIKFTKMLPVKDRDNTIICKKCNTECQRVFSKVAVMSFLGQTRRNNT